MRAGHAMWARHKWRATSDCCVSIGALDRVRADGWVRACRTDTGEFARLWGTSWCGSWFPAFAFCGLTCVCEKVGDTSGLSFRLSLKCMAVALLWSRGQRGAPMWTNGCNRSFGIGRPHLWEGLGARLDGVGNDKVVGFVACIAQWRIISMGLLVQRHTLRWKRRGIHTVSWKTD